MNTDQPHHDEGLDMARRIQARLEAQPADEMENIRRFTGELAMLLISKGLITEKEIILILDDFGRTRQG